MPVKSFELTNIDARRFVKPQPRYAELRVDHNSTVTLITESSEKEASVDFRFTANYRSAEEVIGIIKIEGNLTLEGPARNLVRQWSSSGQMPNEIASEVHTVILSNCLPEAVMIARDIRLPPPLPIPPVTLPGQQPAGKGRSGVEVA